MVTDNPAGLDGLRGRWRATRLLIRTGGRTVDVDHASGDELSVAVAPSSPPIYVVTAHNPGAMTLARSANRARHHGLRRALDERGLAWRVAVGRAEDGSWAETGFAIGGLTVDAACLLGTEFGQLAIFEVTQSSVTVIETDGSYLDSRPRMAS